MVLPHRRPVHRRRRPGAAAATVAVPAGQERVAVVGTVALPTTTPAVGLVAVTEVPAVAASAPVLVGSCRPRTG